MVDHEAVAHAQSPSTPGTVSLSPPAGGGTVSHTSHTQAPSGVAKLSPAQQAAVEGAEAKLDRIVKVEAMVEKRIRFFSYLKKTHREGGFWLNCVLLKHQGDLASYAADLPQHRTVRLFFLGTGLAKLAQTNDGPQLVRAILQLLEEWEYHFKLTSVAHQSMKAMMAKNVDGAAWDAERDAGAGPRAQEHVVTRLFKVNNEVVYKHLLVPHLPFALDYLQVIFSLCDIMCLIYNKFMDEDVYANAFIFDALVRVDGKIKHHVINATAKELTDLSANIAKRELHSLR